MKTLGQYLQEKWPKASRESWKRLLINRKFMHLDTVFTMVDYDKFTITQKSKAIFAVCDWQV